MGKWFIMKVLSVQKAYFHHALNAEGQESEGQLEGFAAPLQDCEFQVTYPLSTAA